MCKEKRNVALIPITSLLDTYSSVVLQYRQKSMLMNYFIVFLVNLFYCACD